MEVLINKCRVKTVIYLWMYINTSGWAILN